MQQDEWVDAVPEKAEKRINSLIKSGNSTIVLTIVGVFIPIVTLFGPLIGFGYMLEASGLLKKYPTHPRASELASAKGKFKVMGIVLGAWLTLQILIVAAVVLTSP